MLAYAAVAALAGWIGVLACAKAVTRRAARPRPARASRGEPPAVVAHLASYRLDGNAFAATLLDLADRGWLALHEHDGGWLYCQLAASAPAERLARYEAMVVGHVAVRADQAGQVPVAVLADDFRPVVLSRAVKSDWRLLQEQVREEAIRRRLVRRVPGGRPLGTMWSLAIVPAVLGAAALGRAFGPGAATAALFGGYLVLGVIASRVLPVERVRPTGRAVLAEWTASAPAAWAVALGRSPDVAAKFAPSGDQPWSSVGGWWHPIAVDARPPKALRPRGTIRFDGQVVRRWAEVTPDAEGYLIEYFVAIDDGRSDLARTAGCREALYRQARPGLTVHARVDLKRNALTALTAADGPELAQAAARQASDYGRPALPALVSAAEAAALIGGPARATEHATRLRWEPPDGGEPSVLIEVLSPAAARLRIGHARRRGRPVKDLSGVAGCLVGDVPRLLLRYPQGVLSVTLRGRPPAEAEFALNRLAPVIAARLPACG